MSCLAALVRLPDRMTLTAFPAKSLTLSGVKPGAGAFSRRGRLLVLSWVWSTALIAQEAPRLAPLQFLGKEPQLVRYEVVDGRAIVEGDIVLGPAEEAERAYRAYTHSETALDKARSSLVRNGPEFRWPGLRVPYTIDNSIQSRVADVQSAIATWNAALRARLGGRDAWVPASPTDSAFVTFRELPLDSCQSAVGRQGGQQFIDLPAGCGPGQIMHEMGHAMGLWHEQSRSDRDSYVKIIWANILPGKEFNFDQHIDPRHEDRFGGRVGAYDYDSIMHYNEYAFAKNPGDPNGRTIVSAKPIGQRNAPSAGDVEGVWVNHEQGGWGVRVCDGTRVDAISFRVGYYRGSTRISRPWFTWYVGDRRDFPFPPDLLFQQHVYLYADGQPHRQVNLCIVYNGRATKSMTFDEDEEQDPEQGDTDACVCT